MKHLVIFASVLLAQCVFINRVMVADDGSITGHVLSSGSNAPLVAARVSILLINDHGELSALGRKSSDIPLTVGITETSINGDFSFPRVPAGTYVVLAEKEGYISAFESTNVSSPPGPIAFPEAPRVRIVANLNSNIDVVLSPGSSIAGTVRFDDGSRDAGSHVFLLRRHDSGRWEHFEPIHLANHPTQVYSDDQGHYRFAGLPPGLYTVACELSLTETQTNAIFSSHGGATSSKQNFSVTFYRPGVSQIAQTKGINLGAAQHDEDIDILIPLASLYPVTGKALESDSGLPINSGTITAYLNGDRSSGITTKLEKEDGTFFFPFLPAGTYEFAISDAALVTRNITQDPPGSIPSSYTVETVSARFSDAVQGGIVGAGTPELVFTVTPKP